MWERKEKASADDQTMDTLVHGIIGAALCSRVGWAGGRRGARKRWWREGSFWRALFFGMGPDLFSLGFWLGWQALHGEALWRGIPDWVLELYRFNHSLFGMAILGALVVGYRRKWGVSFLAWPLHVLCDIPTHGGGSIYATPILWPFSSRGIHGWNWWEEPWMFWGSWGLAAVLWIGVWGMRRMGRR